VLVLVTTGDVDNEEVDEVRDEVVEGGAIDEDGD
jgi:hypothetical protein